MEEKAKFFKALGNTRRLQILNILFKNKEMPVTDIAEHIDLSLKSTSKHLQKLEIAGFIKRKQRSFWGYYKIISNPKNKFLKTLLDLLKNDTGK